LDSELDFLLMAFSTMTNTAKTTSYQEDA
jgi:hypothetical protein